MSNVILAVVTALLSSIFTWGIAYLLYRKRLEAQLEELREQVAAEVEERVRSGAVKAGEELLPQFRKEVTAGFRDALVGSDMARQMAKTGAEIVGGGLDSLFGQRKRARFRPW